MAALLLCIELVFAKRSCLKGYSFTRRWTFFTAASLCSRNQFCCDSDFASLNCCKAGSRLAADRGRVQRAVLAGASRAGEGGGRR
eukprot:706497-Pleurochrysis_carterae.AAC.1